jgi:hypothetical protein
MLHYECVFIIVCGIIAGVSIGALLVVNGIF